MIYTRRELMEILYCLDYAKNYKHGTSGHNERLATSKLARSSSSKIVLKLFVFPDPAAIEQFLL